MAVIIDQIVTEPASAMAAPAEPRDLATESGTPALSMEDLRFEFLRDAQRKARLMVD